MNKAKIIFFFLCFLFTTLFGNGATGQNENNSEEIIEQQNAKQTKCQENNEKNCDIDFINSNDTGPLDSHEAMNTRELKARNKRSTEIDKKAFRNMLLGLVHKKSEDFKSDSTEKSDASELLLELMVRIAAHPQQWDEVHKLLQKIDNDILTSKEILKNLETTTSSPETTESIQTESTTQVDEVQKLIILLDNEQKNSSNWPNFSEEDLNQNSPNDKTSTTQNIYPWTNKQSAKNISKEFEFAYHRVTGLPLPYKSHYDKTRARSAYIAVSVIKKPDNLLENELRQLKPWSHQENLNKMENIRKKWFTRPISDAVGEKRQMDEIP